MTPIRIRSYGSSDWTNITVDGELESETVSSIAVRAADAGLHVQVIWEGETAWEDFDGL